jgi:ABC-2 type transport system permease protein
LRSIIDRGCTIIGADNCMKIANILSRKNRILLAELVRTDFKLRYENSALGYVWSVLHPLLLFGVLYVVFGVILDIGRGIEHFPVYLLTGIVLWRFFTEATKNGLKAIVQRGSLIRKVNFPKYIIVISGTISSLINLGINLFVVLIFMLISGVPLSWEIVFIIPFIIELYVFALGIAFFLSALNVYLRDVANLWEIVIQAAFYATPILYPLTRVTEKSDVIAKLLMMSPAAQVIQDVRFFLVTRESITTWSLFDGSLLGLIPILIVVFTVIAGGLYFRSKSGNFAEHI